jgi:signal peptidase II
MSDIRPEPEAPAVPVLVIGRPRLIAAFALGCVSMIVADLLLKAWAFRYVAPVDFAADDGPVIAPHDAIMLVPKVLALQLTLNEGALFGIGQGYVWLFVVIALAATALVGWMFLRSPSSHRLFHVALALVLAGAIGNMYDRVVYHAVRDMLYLFPGVELPYDWRWPGGQRALYPWIFNLADVFLVVGLIALAWCIVFGPSDRRPDDEPEPA